MNDLALLYDMSKRVKVLEFKKQGREIKIKKAENGKTYYIKNMLLLHSLGGWPRAKSLSTVLKEIQSYLKREFNFHISLKRLQNIIDLFAEDFVKEEYDDQKILEFLRKRW